MIDTFYGPKRGPNGLRVRSQKPGTPAGLRFSPTKEVIARATAAETSDRIDALQGLILEGEPNTACLTFARQQWGVSRAQSYKLLKRTWSQIKDDVNETGIDRLELLAWSIQTLMAAAGQAIKYYYRFHLKPGDLENIPELKKYLQNSNAYRNNDAPVTAAK